MVSPGGIVNAAGFTAGPEGSVAPGSIVAIFGVELAPLSRAAGPGDLEALLRSGATWTVEE